jgi:GTP-binding protein Era
LTNSSDNFKCGYVAIVGEPNVGKSTLLNNLLSYRISSVTRKPQTTRHQIKGILNGDDHQIIFFDTPGILQPGYRLQEAMLQAVQRSLQDADLVLLLLSASGDSHTPDLDKIKTAADSGKPLIVAINKIDLYPKNTVLPLIDTCQTRLQPEAVLPISALQNDGIDILKQEIINQLPQGFPFYSQDQITDHPERFVVAELIREKIFQLYSDEIPYATNVSIDEFKERQYGKDYIKATIYVERSSQKGILIGKKGAALQKIGNLARREIERLLDRPVYLDLWVKVKEKWRKDDKALKEFGYLK